MSKKVRDYLYSNDPCDYQKCFANNLAYYRLKNKGKNGKKLTQNELADMLNISQPTIRNWEQGRNCPEIRTLIEICNTLHCDIDHLLGRIPERTYDNHFICEATGLSEAAVEDLEHNNSFDSIVKDVKYVSKEEAKVYSSITSDLILNHYVLASIEEYVHRPPFENLVQIIDGNDNNLQLHTYSDIKGVAINGVPLDDDNVETTLLRNIEKSVSQMREDYPKSVIIKKDDSGYYTIQKKAPD